MSAFDRLGPIVSRSPLTLVARFAFGLALIGAFFGSSPSVAADSPDAAPMRWSLQFQIGENFTLSSFDGLTVSAKRSWSDASAVRFGLETAVMNRDSGRFNDLLPNSGSSLTETNSQSYLLSALYVRSATPKSATRFFWGMGPIVRYHLRETREQFVEPDGSVPQSSVDEDTTWEAGIRGALGVECFATERMSLHAEYQATGSFVDLRTEHRGRRDDTLVIDLSSDSTSWLLASSGVLFGVSVYF